MSVRLSLSSLACEILECMFAFLIFLSKVHGLKKILNRCLSNEQMIKREPKFFSVVQMRGYWFLISKQGKSVQIFTFLTFKHWVLVMEGLLAWSRFLDWATNGGEHGRANKSGVGFSFGLCSIFLTFKCSWIMIVNMLHSKRVLDHMPKLQRFVKDLESESSIFMGEGFWGRRAVT